MATPFVHLHLHTCYSLLDGACRIEPLMDAVLAHGQQAVAMTDHGNMFGAVEFYTAARSRGVIPIIGCEVYEAPGSRTERKGSGPRPSAAHLVLLAADNTGYANLMRLVTAAHLEGYYYKPRIDRELLARHSRGLIGLSACLKGRVAEQALAGDKAAAARTAGEYADILGKDNFFLELQDHGLPEQKMVNASVLELSKRLGLPLVASNDVHYLERPHAKAHEVLLCIQTGTVLSDPRRMRYGSDQFYLKSGDAMSALFREAPEAVRNTAAIAERCRVDLGLNKELHYPALEVPVGFDAKSYLRHLCREGLQRRYGLKDPDHPADGREREIVRRLNYEIEVIEKTGFLGYFLVVWDFVRFAREQQIPVGPGRGSAAGSLVSYAMGITNVDPLRYRLVFERFLNPERVSPPDFDIDFCQFRRGEVIDYVRRKYGEAYVAQIITFGSLGAKTVIRDVGRVLEIPLAECDRLAKMVPDGDVTLESALAQNPELKQMAAADPHAKTILEYGLVLEGLLRNSGVHAAGVVIGKDPLADLVPLARDKDGAIITQFSKDHVEALGLLKADFLGLKTLTVIDETLKRIRQNRGQAVDLDRIPMDDPDTYALLERGDTIGVFQLESGGMRELVRRIGLAKIEDLIAMIALYRPGPMTMLDTYIENKADPSRIVYDDPRLEPILSETYGIMLYQEQVQQAAHILAGYSLGQGDILRRAMGKKKPEEMERQRASFIEGCRKTSKLPPRKAEKIFDNIAKFAGYGFNKSHSAGYGLIAYHTAYLKAHFPEEFMAALISSEIGKPDKMTVFINEARDMGLDILPPDINVSEPRFLPQPGLIRFGLAGIKTIGEQAAEAVCSERKAGGPFRSLADFCLRLDSRLVNRKGIESLIRCGAMDGLGLHRARLLAGLDLCLARAASTQRDRQAGQGNLFDDPAAAEWGTAADDLPDCAPWPESEQLAAEKELLGVYMSGHPLTQHEPALKRYRLASIAALGELEPGALTRVGGLVVRVDKKFTRDKKEAMAVIQIEDLEGSVEAVVYPSVYQDYQSVLAVGAPVLACAQVKKDEAVSLKILEIYPLDEAPRWFTEQLSLHLPAARVQPALLQAVKQLLQAHPGPVPVIFCLQFQKGQEVFVGAERLYSVDAGPALVRDLHRLLGEEGVYAAVSPQPCRNPAPNGRRQNGR